MLDSVVTVGHKVEKRGKRCHLVEGRFSKSFCRSLDAKGRLMVPAEYREILSREDGVGSFVLTGKDGYLVAYRPAHWKKIEDAFMQITTASPRVNAFMAKFLGRAEELLPDAQGRVRIPQSLMREAGLVKDVQLVGMLRTFQIWDQARFDALQPEDISTELAAMNITIPF